MSQRNDLLERMRAASQQLDTSHPEFALKVGITNNYPALLGREYTAMRPARDLPAIAEETGRLLVHGYAGSGKTQMLYRLYQSLMASETCAVLLRLRDLITAQRQWSELRNSPREQAQILLSRSSPAIDEMTARSIQEPLFVLADGLDEVPSELAASILYALDGLAQRLPNVIVIVTDRFSMRPISTEVWRLAAIQPLDETDRPHLPGGTAESSARILTIPLFVDLLLKERLPASTFSRDGGSMARLLDDFIEGVIPSGTVDQLAQIAYGTYADGRSRVFPVELLGMLADAGAARRLRESGLVEVRSGRASFTQNLVQDYLVARYFAGEPVRWDQRGFDAVSFDGASYDVLVLTAEILAAKGDAARSENFVHQLYDWSFYAVGFVLARLAAIGSHAISSETTVAVEAMMASRRWDRIISTRVRVTDALRLIGDSRTSELLELVDTESLRHWVLTQDGSTTWFSTWRELFLIPDGTAVGTRFVDDIANDQSILGWTAANVLKRTAPKPGALKRLRQMLFEGVDTVRWRAAHALGAFPTPENAAALDETLATDDYPWAQYGAVRSLVEQASLASPNALRGLIIQALVARIETILADERLRIELERSLEIDPVPPNWALSLEPLLAALWDHTSGERQSSWERFASKLGQGQVRLAVSD